jgi:hypothetical protein
MASRIYTVTAKNVTLASAVPLTVVFINPGTTASLKILRCWLSQNGTTTTQQLGVQLSTQVTAFPTLVSVTPAPIDTKDPASLITGATTGAAGTCGINASAEGAGTKTVVTADSFNNLNGYLWVPTPDEQITLPAGSSSGFGIVMLGNAGAAPASLVDWCAGLTFQEI